MDNNCTFNEMMFLSYQPFFKREDGGAEIDNIIPETQMLIFCCPDNEGIYKIITSVKKEET